MSKKIILSLLFLIIICGCSNSRAIKQVTCDEVSSILQKPGAMLIDVRTEQEYNEKHLDKSVNIPLDSLKEQIQTYGTIDFKTPLIVYCKSGKRSSSAAQILLDLGYTNVYDLGAITNCDK